MVIAAKVSRWKPRNPLASAQVTCGRRQRTSISGATNSSIPTRTCWKARSTCSCSSSGVASGVPRRSTARTSVAPSTQPTPPKRSLARADSVYVATTAIATIRSAQPAASQLRGSRRPARPTVGSTNSSTRKPNRSWSTLP